MAEEKKKELVGAGKGSNAVPVIKGRTPAELINNAIAKGANLEQLEKLLTLQERFEANLAKKAYNVAMAQFKSDPPKIDKDKTVSYGTTKYDHASLANVTEKINEALSKCGLSASWKTKQNEVILVTCKITHVQGHSEETTLSASADTSGAKNAIQAIGSTITYLERYTILALTGLATHEQDDDGQASGTATEFISEKQVEQIKDLAMELKIDNSMFCDYMKVDSVEKILNPDFKKAMAVFDAKRKKNAEKK